MIFVKLQRKGKDNPRVLGWGLGLEFLVGVLGWGFGLGFLVGVLGWDLGSAF